MTFAQQIIIIAVVALATLLTRFLPFMLFPEGRPIPRYVKYLGTCLPAAVFALLVVYCLRDVSFVSPHYGLAPMGGVAATVVLHLWRRQMMLSIAGGTIGYMVLIRIWG
jgi:branched-subunit amino acid transport protein AzlD